MSVVRLSKLRPCPVCRTEFRPQRMGQKVCSPSCAPEYVRMREARKAKREIREQRRRLRSRREWEKLAQAAFNAWVRERDHGRPCISCDATEHQTNYQRISGWVASHYRSVGACPELRFEPLNVHKACVRCNSHLSGNIVEYRIRLRERIGEEALAWLEGPHPPKHYTPVELEELAKSYRAKTRELRKARGSC